MDFTVPAGLRVKNKEREKGDKYLPYSRKL